MLSENKILYVHRHSFEMCSMEGFKTFFLCYVSNHGFTVIHLSLNIIQTLSNWMQLEITILCLLHMCTFSRLKLFFVVRNFHFSCTKEQLDCENSKQKLFSHCKWCNFSMAFSFSFQDDEFFCHSTLMHVQCTKKFVRMLSGIFISLFNMTSCLQAD